MIHPAPKAHGAPARQFFRPLSRQTASLFFRPLAIRLLALLLLAVLPLTTACAEQLGLVLSGGGGKGAYQVGVWKALTEYGLAQQVTVMSGTSVGALNAALFSCARPGEAERIWQEEVPDKLTKDAFISQEGLQEILREVPLYKLMGGYPRICATAVHQRWIVGTLIQYITASVGSYASRFWLNDEANSRRIEKDLLASSAFPGLCPAVTLADGRDYVDGGWEAVGGDNIPIAPIAETSPAVKTIFIIYCSGTPERRVKVKDYDWLRITEIIPSIDTAGLFDGTTNFSRNRIRLLIDTGYEDTVAILKGRGLYPVSSYWFD